MSAQVKSVIERILRMKEEQDALAEDIREIYAEAKSNGFDKTALGQTVTAIRKREKNAARYEELNAMAELYLAAYEGGTVVATHAHAHEALSGTVAADTRFAPQSNSEIGARAASGSTSPGHVADERPGNNSAAAPSGERISPNANDTNGSTAAPSPEEITPPTNQGGAHLPHTGQVVELAATDSHPVAALSDEHGHMREDIPDSLRRAG